MTTPIPDGGSKLMSAVGDWKEIGDESGWVMPKVSRWKRLPIVRHVRTIRAAIGVEMWYAFGPGMLGLRTGHDEWVLWGMWRGLER